MSDLHRERDPANYHYGVAIHPFASVTQRWDMPIGFWCERARIWRLACVVVLAVSAFVLLLMLWSLAQPQTSVVALQMTEKGFVSGWGLLDDEYTIPIELKRDFLTKYITAWSGYTNDSTQNQANQQFIDAFTNPEDRQLFKREFAVESQTDTLYNVKVNQIKKVSSSEFLINWERLVVNANNKQTIATLPYQATVQLARVIPQTDSALQQNPLGFYVKKLTISSQSSGLNNITNHQQKREPS